MRAAPSVVLEADALIVGNVRGDTLYLGDRANVSGTGGYNTKSGPGTISAHANHSVDASSGDHHPDDAHGECWHDGHYGCEQRHADASSRRLRYRDRQLG